MPDPRPTDPLLAEWRRRRAARGRSLPQVAAKPPTAPRRLHGPRAGGRPPIGYRGVRPTPIGRWAAQITIDNHTRHLGTFATATEAARAFDRAAILARGLAALLNFPGEINDHVDSQD
jgi:hypothetical protein